MATLIPKETKAIVVRQSTVRQSVTYHAAAVEKRPLSALKSGQILLKINAVAFNHRDVWIRKGMYPRIGFGSVFGADGAGVVIASGDASDPMLRKRVFMNPSRGWRTHPHEPEKPFGVIGGVVEPGIGTFAEYVVVERDEVILSPDHIDDIHTAAWPLAGVTAWRAVMLNAQVEEGQNVLITGIGGGVAIVAMQLCIAKGANVYVTSGSPEKIKRAIELGAKGGVNYKDQDWPKTIATQAKTPFHAIIDSGGGDIMGQMGKYLKYSGRVVCYGMTANPKITFTMREVMRNQQLLGSTMGSYKDLQDATEFLAQHRIIPIVSQVIDGLDRVEEGFELLKSGDHFGKIVVATQQKKAGL